jgi:hypothetical protein
VNVAIEILNQGLRPHLTRWQAEFRKSYDAEIKRDEGALSPQQLQKSFKNYEELLNDMKEVNNRLIRYRDFLRQIAFGEHPTSMVYNDNTVKPSLTVKDN